MAPFDDILLGRSLIGALCVTVHLYDSQYITGVYDCTAFYRSNNRRQHHLTTLMITGSSQSERHLITTLTRAQSRDNSQTLRPMQRVDGPR